MAEVKMKELVATGDVLVSQIGTITKTTKGKTIVYPKYNCPQCANELTFIGLYSELHGNHHVNRENSFKAWVCDDDPNIVPELRGCGRYYIKENDHK
jgi:hypothetical protein